MSYFIRATSATAASVLLLGASLSARADDVGNFFGSVVGGIIGQAMQQLLPQPTYPQPQYYQPQAQPDPAAAEARRQYLAHQAELKRQKLQQQKDDAARLQPAPAVNAPSGTLDVAMKRKDGNLWVPAQTNNVVTIDFAVDSGSLGHHPAAGRLPDARQVGDAHESRLLLGTAQFGIADVVSRCRVSSSSWLGSAGRQPGPDRRGGERHAVRTAATPLLGLSPRPSLGRSTNGSGTLKLTPLGVDQPAPAPTQFRRRAAAFPDGFIVRLLAQTAAPPAAQAPAPPTAPRRRR